MDSATASWPVQLARLVLVQVSFCHGAGSLIGLLHQFQQAFHAEPKNHMLRQPLDAVGPPGAYFKAGTVLESLERLNLAAAALVG